MFLFYILLRKKISEQHEYNRSKVMKKKRLLLKI